MLYSKHDRICPHKLWCTAMHENRQVNLRTLLPTYMYFHCTCNICQWRYSPSKEEPSLDFQQDQECCILATDDQTGSTAYPTCWKKVGAFTLRAKCRHLSGLCCPRGRKLHYAQVFSYSVFSLVSTFEKKWEHNEAVHQIFIDFKKAYDSVRREAL